MPYRTLLFLLAFIPPLSAAALVAPAGRAFNPERALQMSRAAIGRSLEGYSFLDRNEQPVQLADFKGKPLVISLIYTSCYHTCSLVTRSLAEVVEKARDALGKDSFTVVTIGFDTHFDTPKTMAWFARQQGVDDPNWRFLSGDAATVQRLVKNLGFSYFRSPKGFDHLVQASVVDSGGILYGQVYGELFPPPLLVDPLKELILGTPPAKESALANLVRRVRFYCTTYDPTRNAYRFDYSLFVGLFIGASIILGTSVWLYREMRGGKRLRNS